MPIRIRTAQKEDFGDVLALIKELAHFEKNAEAVTNTVAQMEREQGLFTCLVAESEEKEIVGMALFFFAYYTWVGKSLYLDDLYVKASCRGKGIGLRLLKKVVEIGRQEGCKRIRWQVLDWNAPAIAMYKTYGATIDGEWLNCDLDAAAIAALAKG